MPMKTSVSRVLFSMIIIATSLQLLCAQNEGNTPHTIRDEDKQYITTGSVLIPAAVKDARQIIEAVDRWNAWMFAGMDGNGPAERFLRDAGASIDFVPADFRRFEPILHHLQPRVMATSAASRMRRMIEQSMAQV